MRLLVTGGAGYVGSTTAALLLENGHDVVVLDDVRSGHRHLIPVGARLIEAGISMQRPEAFYRNNTAATLLLVIDMTSEVRRSIRRAATATSGRTVVPAVGDRVAEHARLSFHRGATGRRAGTVSADERRR